MNGMIRLLAVALAVAAMAGTADAAGGKGKGGKGHKAGARKAVCGKIVSVAADPADASKATVVIQSRKGGQVTIQTNASTVVKVDRKAARTGDLKAGMRVRAMSAAGAARKVIASSKAAGGHGKAGKGKAGHAKAGAKA